MHKTLNPNQHKDFHRLRRLDKVERGRTLGLGSPLGEALPTNVLVDREAVLSKMMRRRGQLEEHAPGVFEMSHFLSLEHLGGRREGGVREIVFPDGEPFTTPHRTWKKLAIKNFYKHARTGPEKQALAMHSLSVLCREWFIKGLLPSNGFGQGQPLIKVPDAITFKYPFSVMRSLNEPNILRADELSEHMKRTVYSRVFALEKLIVKCDRRKIENYKQRGIEYPNPDFNPTNVMVEMARGDRIWAIWIIDQSSVEGGPTYEDIRQRGSFRIMISRRGWGI
jgi:hypothetical protein